MQVSLVLCGGLVHGPKDYKNYLVTRSRYFYHSLEMQTRNILNRIRRLFREAIILFFALYFMSDYPLTDYLTHFTLLLMAVYSLYEIGYIYNDFIRVKYDEKPTIRSYVE